jgi:hypothetical protein
MHRGRSRSLTPCAWEQQKWKEEQENKVGEKGCMEKAQHLPTYP